MANDIMEEIKKVLLELSKSQKETDKKIKETAEQMKETAEQMKETDKKMKETDKRWEKLEKQYWIFGNFVNNDWKVVEEYFYTALDKANELHWEKYSLSKWVEQEFDIIWYNGDKITAIEVKKIVHKNDVKKLIEKQLPFLKKFMWWMEKYKNHRIYWWIAGFKINKDAKEYAKKHWIIILTKNSKNKVEELSKDFEIKAYE